MAVDKITFPAFKQAVDLVDTDAAAVLVKLLASADGSDTPVTLTATTFADMVTQMTAAAASLASILALQNNGGLDPADLRDGRVNISASTTAVDVIAAAGASIPIVVTGGLVINQHASTDTLVEILDGGTAQRDGFTAHVRGIFDDEGRLMVVINWNTDLGDALEHAENPYYPLEYSTFASELFLNMIMYSLTS